MNKKIITYIATLFCVFFFFEKTFSQENKRNIPSLNSHEFIQVTGSKSPFIETTVFTYMGYGETENYSVPLFDLGDYKAIGLTGEILFADLVFNYQQRIRNWLAFYVRYNLAARLGADVQSVLGHGFNTITSFEIGWKIKLIERPKYILSTHIELQNHTGNFVNILGFIKDIRNNHLNPKVSEKVPVLTGGTGLMLAYGINDLFGFLWRVGLW